MPPLVTNLALLWDAAQLGCSVWAGNLSNLSLFKMLSDSGSVAPGSDCKYLNFVCMDVLRLTICVSAHRIRTLVINNN